MAWTAKLPTIATSVGTPLESLINEPFRLMIPFDPFLFMEDNPYMASPASNHGHERANREQEELLDTDESRIALAESVLVSIAKNAFMSESSRVRSSQILLERYDLKKQIALLQERITTLEQQNSGEATMTAQ